MKAQIGIRINPLNGFLNIDLAAKQGESDRVPLDDIGKLDNLVDANELSFFQINDTLDFLPLRARAQCLQHLLTRMAHGGTFIMMGVEPIEVGRLLYNGTLSIQQVNDIIYGIGRKSMLTLQDNVGYILGTGQFDLESAKYDDKRLNYVLTFKRK